MDRLISEQDVPRAHKGGDDGRGRRDAIRVYDRRLGLQKGRERALELKVHVERAVKAARAARAATVLAQRGLCRGTCRLRTRHAQKVGRAQLERRLTFGYRERRLESELVRRLGLLSPRGRRRHERLGRPRSSQPIVERRGLKLSHMGLGDGVGIRRERRLGALVVEHAHLLRGRLDLDERLIELRLGVRCGDAEAHTREQQRCGRVAHDDDREVTPQARL